MARGPEKQFDREAALVAAMGLFRAKGYDGTSLADLLAAMGIGRKSLYDTFGNKRALYLSAIEHYSKVVLGRICDALNDPSTPALDNVKLVMRTLAKEHSQQGSTGCLLGVGMAQASSNDPEVSGVLRAHMNQLERAYRQAFMRAQSEGALKSTTNTVNLAHLFMSAHQGMALLGRVSDTSTVQNGIAEGALATLEAA